MVYLRENGKMVVKNLKITACLCVPLTPAPLSPRADRDAAGGPLGKPPQEFHPYAHKLVWLTLFCYDTYTTITRVQASALGAYFILAGSCNLRCNIVPYL